MSTMQARAPDNLHIVSLGQAQAGIRDEVLAGLQRQRKHLPPKLFYDAVGAGLFQELCATSAYYPTRTETAILKQQAGSIARALGEHTLVIEPGAGEMRKIRLLLAALRPVGYTAIDVSAQQLVREAERLAREYPWLAVTAVVGDFHDARVRRILADANGRPVLFFPGSTIGNFEPSEALAFLREARTLTGDSGGCVIGVDLVKARSVLDLAYDDPEGITARFNLNLLARLNRELGANFDLAQFRHHAFYDESLQRVEMHLVSRRAQEVQVAGVPIPFRGGESIHTENSYKYHPQQFERMARDAGFERVRWWTDAQSWFAVFLLGA